MPLLGPQMTLVFSSFLYSQEQISWTMSVGPHLWLLAGVGQWGSDKRLERERWDTLLPEQSLVF